MGGRGSEYFKKRTQEVEQKVREKFHLITDENNNDSESKRNNYDLFKKLKAVKISTRESTDKHSLEDLKPHQEQILKLAKKYNNILTYGTEYNEMLLKSARTNASGYFYGAINGSNKKGQSVVVLSNLLISNNQEYVKMKSKLIQDGTSVKIDEENIPIYTTTHEFGHVLENCLMDKLLNKINNSEQYYQNYKNNLATKIKNEVITICKNKYKDDNIYLSNYAKTGDTYGFEWFAETFTNLELSSKPAPIAKALGDYLKEIK